jgi:flagellar basal-body rod modification protein FlgD
MPPEPIPPVSGAYAPVAPGPAAKPPPTDVFSSDGFLKLLASQVRAQNPLEPMKDTEFLAQMAQFSQLEQMTALRNGLESLNLSGQLAQGAALVGKTVRYTPTDGGAPVSGVVERVAVPGTGREMTLTIGGTPVEARRVVEVGA